MHTLEIFVTESDLISKTHRVLQSPETIRLLQEHNVGSVKIEQLRPSFQSNKQVSYLRSIGVKLDCPKYRVYIGSDIVKPTEKFGGSEFPAEVLDNPETFCDEVIKSALKYYADSIGNN